MPLNRSDLIEAPARVVHGSFSCYSQEAIEPVIEQRTFKIETDPHGVVDERKQDVEVKLSVTPDGRFDATVIAALWPYLNYIRGQHLWDDTDVPLYLHPNAGNKKRVVAAKVTKMPDVVFSAVKSLIGQVEYTGLRGNGLAWSAANGLYIDDDGAATFVDASFAGSLIKTQPYTLAWSGKTGFTTAIESEDGFTLSFQMNVEPVVTDTYGTINYRFLGLEAMLKFKPLNVSAANIIAAMKVQDTGAGRGGSLLSDAAALTLVGADAVTYLTIPKAALRTGGFRFGAAVLKNGELGFYAARSFSSGVQQALLTLAAT